MDFEFESIRSDGWLVDRVRLVRQIYFGEVNGGYEVVARFGKRSRRRYGSIMAKRGASIITMNGLFRLPVVPEFVVDAVIAHELAHYAHGYGSGLPKQHAYPHRGGVIGAELASRGLADLELRGDEWLKANWERIWNEHASDIAERVCHRKDRMEEHWRTFLAHPERRTDADLSSCFGELTASLNRDQTALSVDWLIPSPKQAGMSYLYRTPRVVRVHAALSDRKAPEACLISELGYWLCSEVVGRDLSRVREMMIGAGFGKAIEEAATWRRCGWTRFRKARLPG